MLKCVSKYSSSNGTFVVGDVIEDPKLEAILLADSEGSFVVVKVQESADDIAVSQAALVDNKPLRKRRVLED